MNRMLALLSISLFLGVSGYAEKLTVSVVSDRVDGNNYTFSTPTNTNTNCTSNGVAVNCNSTSTGGGNYAYTQYSYTHVVKDSGSSTYYTIRRTQTCDFCKTYTLVDGGSYSAEIKGNHMFVTIVRGDNPRKTVKNKYNIIGITR